MSSQTQPQSKYDKWLIKRNIAPDNAAKIIEQAQIEGKLRVEVSRKNEYSNDICVSIFYSLKGSEFKITYNRFCKWESHNVGTFPYYFKNPYDLQLAILPKVAKIINSKIRKRPLKHKSRAND